MGNKNIIMITTREAKSFKPFKTKVLCVEPFYKTNNGEIVEAVDMLHKGEIYTTQYRGRVGGIVVYTLKETPHKYAHKERKFIFVDSILRKLEKTLL